MFLPEFFSNTYAKLPVIQCCVNQIPSVSVDGAHEMGTKCFSNPGILCKVVVEALDGIPIFIIQLEAAIELREDRQLSLSSSVVFRIRMSRKSRPYKKAQAISNSFIDSQCELLATSVV